MTGLYFSMACWLFMGFCGGYLGWSDGGWRAILWLGLSALSTLAGYGAGAFTRTLWNAWKAWGGA